MGFQRADIINRVFEACCSVCENSHTFSAEAVVSELNLPPSSDKTGAYWQNKNITNTLSNLESINLIKGTIHPEYTPNRGFLLEVRRGEVTPLGKVTGPH
jgi:hypothetical protein